MRIRRNRLRSESRRGATLVEMGVVLPVFFIFLFGLFEFGHAYMVVNILNAAAKRAAREGVADGVTTSDVQNRVLEILSSAIDTSDVTVQIKDASTFDSGSVDAGTVDYDSLPAIELNTAEPRQLFVVRIQVPYDSVAVFPPKWVEDITLTGQSVMRHE